ncbi:ABC-2 type transport system ATP-binding protein [Kineothrix alysoides]|uniref:ABC-2 type transport system ATP-binding protein n=1 Tax=Kineothrix alysoides TaxID=1469948 RepID=A0A4R1QVN5_9FIRM|nr:ABC transporter ATP-binding protein [Kineothrix alysoides]TCL54250.1 ABC-2 type transport system ATP-binding protein [Kineothrix alysoides]
MKAVRLVNVGKSFGEKEVLRNVGFEIEEGEIFGLLGPSGAGKTTLIRILTGQLAGFGEAFVFGESCDRLKENNYREIGMVMDNSGIYERLDCYDNLKLFVNIYKIDKKIIEEVLGMVGLSAEKKTPAGKLSKGMKQRLILARAILHRPKLLFLDEPTSGLDPATTKSIHELLLRLRSEGTTIFLTTHNMEEATKLCDNVALLHEGKIIEYGRPGQLCRKYNQENKISILIKNEQLIMLANLPENAARIEELFKQGEVVSIHSSEPDLEQVFLTLTGRGLEE